MTSDRHLTRDEAAAVCGCHVDTIRRYERLGKLPNRRQGADGKWYIPVSDLVAAGLLDPVASNDDLPEIAERTKAQRQVAELREKLAAFEAKVAVLEDQLEFFRRWVVTGKAA